MLSLSLPQGKGGLDMIDVKHWKCPRILFDEIKISVPIKVISSLSYRQLKFGPKSGKFWNVYPPIRHLFWLSLFSLSVCPFFGHFHSNPPLCNPSLRPVGLGAYGPFAAPQTYVTDLLGVVIIYMIIIIISCHNLWNQLWGWKVENFSYVTFIKNSLPWLLAIGWA